MKPPTFAILFFIFTVNACSQTETPEFNFGFEKTTPNQKLPDNWFDWGMDGNLSIDTMIKHNGRNSVLIYMSEKKDSNSFGCVAYLIPAI